MRLMAGSDATARQAADEVEAAGLWAELVSLALRWKTLPGLEARLAALRILPPTAVRAEIAGHTSRVFVQSMLCIRSGTTALTALEEAGIACLGFKGLATVGLLYGGPRSRMLQDVDVLVRPEQAEQALGVLEAIGFHRSIEGSLEEYVSFVRSSPGSAGNEAVSLTDARGGAVDLHWRLGVVEPDVLLAGARRLRLHDREVPVARAGHCMLLSVHHALRNDFVPDDIGRDVCDFSRWRVLLSESGEWTKIAPEMDRWGLKQACLAINLIVTALGGPGDGHIPMPAGEAEMRGAQQLCDLYFHQLVEETLNTDLAYLASPRPAMQIFSGVAGGWRRYIEFMRKSEQTNGEVSLPLRTRLWRLAQSATRLSPSQWRQIRALAKAKEKLSGKVLVSERRDAGNERWIGRP